MSDDAGALHGTLDHPVVDADGHIVEAIPVLVDYLRKVAGGDVADRFAASSATFSSRSGPLLPHHSGTARPSGSPIPPWWALPTTARDRATGFLPRLFHERLDELGIDFAILYSSVGLTCLAHPDEAIRVGSCKALNTYLADMLDGLEDRMAAAAVIPSHTPEEAIAALDHAVGELGFRTVLLNCCVPRPGSESNGDRWFDVLALDSIHDYDPLWSRCVELGVAVTAHSPTQGIPLRQSSSRYMYNHIGNFAASGEAFAKAVVLGGVTHRFPTLNFAFLECGVGWGVQLLCDFIGRWEKRGGANIDLLDPRHLDIGEWDDLLQRYGGDTFRDAAVRQTMRGQSDNPPDERDDFRACGVEGPSDIVAQFDRLYFGCEADDPTVVWAFARNVNPEGAVLRAMLGSDIGHWDVPDARQVLPEAHELVDRGLLDAQEFRAFACDNAIRLHAGMNPSFFEGSPVAGYARSLLTDTSGGVEVAR